MDVIGPFVGEHHFLSNFHPSPFVYDGKVWPTVEHFYQASKTTIPELQERIRLVSTPALAKKLGGYKTYQGEPVLRPDWPSYKQRVMKIAINAKFDQNPDLADKLFKTYGSDLVEINGWHDNFWGRCICEKCQSARKVVGQNWLGYFLKEKREQLMIEWRKQNGFY